MNEEELTELWVIQTAILYHQGVTKLELLDNYGIPVEYVFRGTDYEELHNDEIETLLKNG
jgi:hypothetical protein